MLTDDKCFHFADGRKASSIKELKEILNQMSEAEFRHHVNNERNDFANWVEGVFEERKLAQNMREVSEREGLIIILNEFFREKKHKMKSHEKLKRLIIPKNKIISQGKEKELSGKDIKGIVDEAKHVLSQAIHKTTKKPKHRRIEHPDYTKFVVKEFIYGFVLGLIFGLIMLGIIFNLKP
ncbi:hypothetical protein KY348_02870 [Candidatus Woesearchaeota archaeon]|nr:hypothetical protein [Candidatus Woesearchaeota archaeon]